MIEKYFELAAIHFSSLSLILKKSRASRNGVGVFFSLMMLFTSAIINFTHKHTSELILSHNETTAVTRHQNHRLIVYCAITLSIIISMIVSIQLLYRF
jgi:hypothetical protein